MRYERVMIGGLVAAGGGARGGRAGTGGADPNSPLERSSPSVCRSRVASQASLDVCEAGYALLDFRVERRRA